MANNYPITPNPSDKETFRLTFNNMLRYMPCQDNCVANTRAFESKNPMRLDSRKDLKTWLCELKNDDNKRQGKEVYDCSSLVNDNNNICHDCTVPAVAKDNQKVITDSTGYDRGVENSHAQDAVTDALQKSKESKKQLFLALCKKHNVPVPKSFEHKQCPTHPETSCIDYHDMENVTPYLNPYTDSDKQTIHEFEHYRALLTEGKISSEESAEKFAYSIISQAFPIASTLTQPHNQQSPQSQNQKPNLENPSISPAEEEEAQPQPQMQEQQLKEQKELETTTTNALRDDVLNNLENAEEAAYNSARTPMTKTDSTNADIANTVLINSTQPKPKKPKMSWYDKTIADVVSNSSVAIGDIDNSLEGNTAEGFEQRFPNYARAVRESQMKKKEVEIEKKLNEGFISYLDPVYQFPAKVLGIKPGQMNLAHTPNIIMNVVQTLVESNMTPIGSGLFAFLTGISLFVAGYLGKSSIAFRDQLALQNISAAFLWRTLQYINPKYDMKKDLKKMHRAVQDGKFNISDTLIETPGQWKKKQQKQKNAWTNMPHYLGKDEKGRPAFIIPAPAAFATMGMGASGAPMGGGTGPTSEFTMPIHQGGNIGGLQMAGPSQDSQGEPMYQLGSGYFETGDDPFAFDQSGGMTPGPGSIGPIDPDVLRNVTTVGM